MMESATVQFSHLAMLGVPAGVNNIVSAEITPSEPDPDSSGVGKRFTRVGARPGNNTK